MEAGKISQAVQLTPAAPQKATDMMKMAEASAPEPKDSVETGGFWSDVKKTAQKGADISSSALGGFIGLTMLGTGIYVGALGGALGGAYLGGGIGLLKASATSSGFLGFWKTVFGTGFGASKLGILAGGSAVGYGSWKLGRGVGDMVAAVPGFMIGGAVGIGMAIANKLKGDGGEE